MHDLYFEFAERVVERDDKEQGRRPHLYHKNENNIPQCLTRNPRGGQLFSFERMRFSNVYDLDSFKQAKLDKCANVEVLKVDRCFELESLDIGGLEELRSLELIMCPELDLQGLEKQEKLVWMRWDPCNVSVVDYKALTSLRVLQLSFRYFSHCTPIDLRNCHNLQELAIEESYLENFPLFPNSKSMRKISFSHCNYLRHHGPELLNLEGWMNVEFLDLSRCKSVTDELERCPIMRNLKQLDVSECHKLKALPDLTKSKSLITLYVTNCTELLKSSQLYSWLSLDSYASSSRFWESMHVDDLHVGLNTLGVPILFQHIASRIISRFGVSPQVCSLPLKG